jgi:CheY-like chemotaxis protein
VVRAFSDILCAASDAREIVRRLREFYRPEEQLAVQPIQVKDLIGRVIDLTKPAWKTQAEAVGKEIRMVTEIDSAISLTGNEAALREMLTNLTLNAIDAIIRQGTIKFKIAQNEHWIEIQVSDTGAGMTEEVRQRCFEPFYTTKGEQGTGLGLAMCYGIVQRHNGHIEVASELGQGTTFTIRLPREAAQGEAREAKEEKVLSRKRRALRVLVVDDEEVSRALLVKYLSGAGHTVTAVASGPEAVRLIQNQAFDLVLTDRAMPGMSGDEVAKTVKRLAPGLPIIMLTGLGEMMKFKSEHPVGVDAVVGKPITPTELEAAIRQVLVKRKKTPS